MPLINGYQSIKEIGYGGEARVYLAKKGKTCYALKRFRMSDGLNEVRKLSLIKSPFVVKYIEDFSYDGHIYIVLEFVEGGDLTQLIYIYRDSHIPESLIL